MAVIDLLDKRKQHEQHADPHDGAIKGIIESKGTVKPTHNRFCVAVHYLGKTHIDIVIRRVSLDNQALALRSARHTDIVPLRGGCTSEGHR